MIYDSLVVGAGIAGCATALHLARLGQRVCLIDQHEAGWGASGEIRASCGFGLALPIEAIRYEAAATAPGVAALGPVLCGQALFRSFTPKGIDPPAMPRHPAERADPGFTEQITSMPDDALHYGCAYGPGLSDAPTDEGQNMARTILSENIPRTCPSSPRAALGGDRGAYAR